MKTKIPHYYEFHCDNPKIYLEECPYYITSECPNTCYLAVRLSKGISHKAKTGLERFLSKYPDWNNGNEDIGIGAMVSEDLRRLK